MLDRNGTRLDVVGQQVYALSSHALYTVTRVTDQGFWMEGKASERYVPQEHGNKQVPLIAIEPGSRLKDLLPYEGMIDLYQDAQLVGYRIPVVTETTFDIEYEGGRNRYYQKGLAIKTFPRDYGGMEEARAFFKECAQYNSMDPYRFDDGTLMTTADGGYPLYYLDNEHNVLCPKCANKEGMSTTVVAADVNWEDTALYCDDGGEQIPSAYGDDENMSVDVPSFPSS